MDLLRIGIDIGGTFTDFVVLYPETKKIVTFKLLSSPDNPADAVITGLISILSKSKETLSPKKSKNSTIIVHGSTVATNALLERKGPDTALITTAGFRDILQIGRQNRPSLYNFFESPLPALVSKELRFEVGERVDHKGNILKPLDSGEIDNLITEIKRTNAKTIAVCLLFSFLNPDHEMMIGKKLRQAGYQVSLSSEIVPEFREYERTSTTTVNAYVSPVLDNYLSSLEKKLPSLYPDYSTEGTPKSSHRLQVMQSNGGIISSTQARREAIRCILSGPAGGVVGCNYIGRLWLNLENKAHLKINPSENREDNPLKIITFDMGGTSTDVSIIDEIPQITTESIISGCPIRIPMLNIHTIGAGGGSIAQMDSGGALRVGPESAGAKPGPACYGLGEFPTVSDANVVLGRIPVDHFLGGRMPLEFDRACSVLEKLGKKIKLTTEQVALGIVAVVNAHMERAIRVISVERGYDPREFTLLSFGGAGGLHASELARNIGIRKVLIPPLAATLSAFGMLAADVIKDYVQTIMLPGTTPFPKLRELIQPLVKRGISALLEEGLPQKYIHIERYLDIRYLGQSYKLTVPFSKYAIEEFHQLHKKYFGYFKPGALIEIVNLRVKAIGEVSPPPITEEKIQGEDPHKAMIDTRDIFFSDKRHRTPLYSAEKLQPGNLILGPGVIVREDTTLIINPYDKALVDSYKNILIEVRS